MKESAAPKPPFWQDLPGVLAFPARPKVLGTIAVYALVRLVSYLLGASVSLQWFPRLAFVIAPTDVAPFAIDMFIEAVLWLMAMKLAIETLTDTCYDRADATASGQAPASDRSAIRQLLLLAIFFAVPYSFLLLVGPSAAWLGLLAALACLPAAIMVLALEESLLHALNPLAWRELVQRIGPVYFTAVAALGVLLLSALGLQSVFASVLPGWLAAITSRFVALYALVAVYHVLGSVLHQGHEALGLDITPPIVRPKLASHDEDTAMREADVLAAGGEPGKGADRLELVLRRGGASLPIHERYRELLASAREFARLDGHAREYVHILLALGNEKRALALVSESLARNHLFQVDDEKAVTRLIAYAEATGQSQMAISLADGFGRRFPKSPDIVRNGLVQARLMADRQGRVEEARHLLEGLLEDYPEDPLVLEIKAAFNSISRQRST